MGPTASASSTRDAALALLDARPLSEIAWASPEELQQHPGIGPARAAAIAAAFELGRRGAWAPPKRGERVLDPARVHELLRHVAHSEGSLASCPVHPRDVLREPIRIGAHSIIFAHGHPSGACSPSPEDVCLTDRLCAACDLVGIVARDHVVLGTEGYFSFVEAGRWRR
jgi:DNA repair protein RadC